jgi:hypothetical protein
LKGLLPALPADSRAAARQISCRFAPAFACQPRSGRQKRFAQSVKYHRICICKKSVLSSLFPVVDKAFSLHEAILFDFQWRRLKIVFPVFCVFSNLCPQKISVQYPILTFSMAL